MCRMFSLGEQLINQERHAWIWYAIYQTHSIMADDDDMHEWNGK